MSCRAARLLEFVLAEVQEQFGDPQEEERLLLETRKPLPNNGSNDVTTDTSKHV